MLKVMGIDFFKRKVISWFFKPDRDGWYVDQRKIDQETIQHRIWHASGEKMAVYRVIKGQITSYKYATGFNTFINVEISDLITKGSKTSFKIKFGSRSFKGLHVKMSENFLKILDFFVSGKKKCRKIDPCVKMSENGGKMSENSRDGSIPKCLRKIGKFKILKSSSKSACPV